MSNIKPDTKSFDGGVVCDQTAHSRAYRFGYEDRVDENRKDVYRLPFIR